MSSPLEFRRKNDFSLPEKPISPPFAPLFSLPGLFYTKKHDKKPYFCVNIAAHQAAHHRPKLRLSFFPECSPFLFLPQPPCRILPKGF